MRRLTDNSAFQPTLGAHFALLVLLAAVHRLLRGGNWYFGERFQVFELMTGVCSGLFVAQISLVGWWAAFSGRSTALRGAALLLLVPLLAAVQSQVFNDTNFFVWWYASPEDSALRYATWIVELSLLALLVVACGFALRLLGFRVSVPDGIETERGWRLQLVELVGWIAVLSVAFAAGNWTHEYGWSWRHAQLAFEWSEDRYFLVKGEFLLLASLLAAGLLWPNSPRWGIGLLFLLPLAFSLFDNWLMGRLGPNTDDSVTYYHRKIFSHDTLAVMYYVFGFALGGNLLVLRDRGYRLTWRRSWHVGPTSPD